MEGRAPGGRVVEASAPCHVELVGGALDAWPPALSDPELVKVTVAIDRRASCRVEMGSEGVEIESKESSEKQRGSSVAELLAGGRGGLAASVLQALGVETDVRVVTQARAVEASVLGSASALAITLTAAVARATGRELPDEELVALSCDAELRARKLPAAVGGHYAALRGGVLAVEKGAAGVKVERPLVDPARVEESLLLVDAGADRESDARARPGPRSRTPALEWVIELVRTVGAEARVSGGMIVIWAPPGARGPGRREAVRVALERHGLRVMPARVDLRGLDLEEVA